MKRGKTIEKLIDELEIYIPVLLGKEEAFNEVSTHLNDVYGIDESTLAYVLNNSKRLDSQDDEFLALLAEQISLKVPSARDVLQLEEWYSESEIKTLRKYAYDNGIDNDEISLSLTVENAEDLGDGTYLITLWNTEIARLFKYNVFKYNFDIQRDAKIIIRGGEEIKVPNLVRRNIEEMTDLILKRKLKRTMLALNCAVGTTDDPSGMEIIYNDKTRKLTITEGTIVDILDGAHRINAYHLAYKKDRNITGKTPILLTNYTTKQAQDFQVQLSKQTQITEARITQLEEKSFSVELVNRLNSEGMLRDKIAVNGKTSAQYYVLFTELVVGFDVLWQPTHPIEINKIMNAFNEYIEYLTYYYGKNNTSESLLMDKKLFAGHIALAKKMHEQGVPYEKLDEILDKHNWNNDNIKLTELKDKLIKMRFSKRSVLDLGKYFEKLI